MMGARATNNCKVIVFVFQASGAEYVPSHPCTGTAPFCDLGFATDAPTPPSVVEDCTENGQRLPDPIDCHM